MDSSNCGVATGRSAWLVQLAQAIDDAQQLAWRLGVTEGKNSLAVELYFELEAARIEVQLLRGAFRAENLQPWPLAELFAGTSGLD